MAKTKLSHDTYSQTDRQTDRQTFSDMHDFLEFRIFKRPTKWVPKQIVYRNTSIQQESKTDKNYWKAS